tara:strand:- start:4545 stop:6803 length:2259 start_codon:yes stop_codon:yes gene_type:complete
MSITQDGRYLAIETPLGTDALLLESFSGEEGFSQLYEFHLDLLSVQGDLEAKSIVGKPVQFGMTHADGETRSFGGYINRFSIGPVDGGSGLRRYRATVVPWLWFLSKKSNCRIFQEKSVIEIIEQVFADAGFDAFETTGVTGTHPALEYCVQYDETDFAFVSRLMEDEGIYYYFRHEDTKQVLVMADSDVGYCESDPAEVPYDEGTLAVDHIHLWEHQFEFISGKWSHLDFNFETPLTSLFAESPTVIDQPGTDDYERFEYPGKYADAAHADDKTKSRMEAEEAFYDIVHGASGVDTFTPGAKFTLSRHAYPSEEGKEYVLTSVQHHAHDGSYTQRGAGNSYENSFACAPAKIVVRPKLRTPRPRIQGPQTAMVTGPAGEEIHTDKYGRIKVQFHWDREGQRDEKSSCWVRVAQATAGKTWGFQALPRINQEVIVVFLDGDPDRPIVTGALYNAETMPTYELPTNKTQTGLKSRSSKDAGADNYNEFRFEDKKGSEQIFLHAERNLDSRIKNNSMESVGHDRHLSVQGDQKEEVQGEKHLTVGGDHFEQFGANQNLTIGGDQNAQIGGSQSLQLGVDRKITLGSDDNLTVGGDLNMSVGMDTSLESGMNVHNTAGMNYAVDAGMGAHIKAGMNVVIEAGVQLTLKAGGGFITIGPAGVDITGPMVKINSGGAAGSGSGASPKAPAPPDAPDVPKEVRQAARGTSTAQAAKVAAPSAAATGSGAGTASAIAAAAQAQTLKDAAKNAEPFAKEC